MAGENGKRSAAPSADRLIEEPAEWLALTSEETLEPDLPICDPHHHLWDHPGNRYLLDDVLEDTGSGHAVVKTVFVECNSMYRHDGPAEMRPVGETEFVQGIAAMSASGGYGATRIAAGIVSFADLTLGSKVEPVLQAHIGASNNRFRGIRHASGWDPSDGIRNSHTNPPNHLLLDDKFREGFALLDKLGLSFDAWFYHTQMDDFIDLARAFPNVTIVLDHFGGPLGIDRFAGKQDEVFDHWRAKIAEVADCHNVVLKLGGINMKINGFGWHQRARPPGSEELAKATARYYLHCIDLFGANRCMFESNFPVDRDSCSYNVLWNSFKRMTTHLNKVDRSALFHDTAARTYRLL